MIVIKVLSIIFVLIGVVLLGIGLFVYQDTRDFLNRARATDGVVTEVARRTVWHRFTSTVYDYTVRYVPSQGDGDRVLCVAGA